MKAGNQYPPTPQYERQFSRENMQKIEKIREQQRQHKLVPQVPQPGSSRRVNYNNLDKKGSWLDKYAGNMDELKDLALSGSFEQMEQKIISRVEEGKGKSLYNQEEMSKIVDTLDLSNPKALQFEKGGDHTDLIEEELENQVLTNEFMNELGIPNRKKDADAQNNTRKIKSDAFDCDISALNNPFDKSQDSVEIDLVKQMTPDSTQNLMKKQKNAKVITNIEAARNAHKLQQRQKRRHKEKLVNKKKSLRDKFRIKLEHGKVIQNDPDAFTNESEITINQNTTLNKFNPHNPANFPTSKHEVQQFDSEIQKLESELTNLNQYAPQINKIEKFIGVNKGYRHTKDFLNKHNQQYELEETLGYHEEDDIEESVGRLDDLLAQKKMGGHIPFVGGPARVMKKNNEPLHLNHQQNMNYGNQKQNRIPHQLPPQQPTTYKNLEFAQRSPQMVRKQPVQNIRQNNFESNEFVNTNQTKAKNYSIQNISNNKFSNHADQRDSLNNENHYDENMEDPEDMVTFDVEDAYDQELEGVNYNHNQNKGNVLNSNEGGYEIGAYKSGKNTFPGQRDQRVGSKPNINYQQNDPSISQMKTVYSEFTNDPPKHHEKQYQRFSEFPNTIQEDSAENLGTPQIHTKKPTNMAKTDLNKKSLYQSIEEEFEESQEETIVKGYAGRVQRMKKMKRRMEAKFSNPVAKKHTGKPPQKTGTKKEVVIETEHGNMMVKGGVDLKKLFLS